MEWQTVAVTMWRAYPGKVTGAVHVLRFAGLTATYRADAALGEWKDSVRPSTSGTYEHSYISKSQCPWLKIRNRKYF